MAGDTTSKVLQILIDRELLEDGKKLSALQEQLAKGVSLTQVLVDTKLVSEDALAKVQAEVLGLPFIDLREITIPRDVMTIIPESMARGHMIIAYEQKEGELKVAMADPTDRQIVEFVRKKIDKPVEVALASASAIRDALALYQQSLEAELGDVASQSLENIVADNGDLGEAADDLPIIRVVQTVLKHAAVEGASDIHIEPTEQKVIVRYRIDGILRDELSLPKAVLPGMVARIKVLANLKIDEHRLPQDGRFKQEWDDYKVAFRVSILPVFDGEKVVMRLLDESGSGLTLESIGLRDQQLERLRRSMHSSQGMILVTGPTGSGKTTTLYAAMKELSTPGVNISTVEDPIEYRIPRINQTQVRPRIGLTFANGLRALVRQDPDIIMVGEIRDEETAALAVNAALTGHLVLSTLHTSSAAGALPRLRDMNVKNFLLVSTLNLIMAQRLVRKLCEKCRRQRRLTQTILEELRAEFDLDAVMAILQRDGTVKKGTTWSEVVIYEPGGCKFCDQGYKGRIGIYEVLEITEKLREMISTETTSDQLEKVARKEQGMVTMMEDGLIKAVSGVTSLEEIMRVARE